MHDCMSAILIALLILRKDHSAIGSNSYAAAGCHRVHGCAEGFCVMTIPVAKKWIVAAPIAIEAQTPAAVAWKADAVIAVSPICEIEHYDYIIAIAALFPAMEGDEFVLIVEVMDIHM